MTYFCSSCSEDSFLSTLISGPLLLFTRKAVASKCVAYGALTPKSNPTTITPIS